MRQCVFLLDVPPRPADYSRQFALVVEMFGDLRLDQRLQMPDQRPGYLGEDRRVRRRSEEHTSELQSLMRISYAVFCLKKKKNVTKTTYSFHMTMPPQVQN